MVVKGLFRVTGNLRAVPGDCGSVLGAYRQVTASNMHNIVGFTAILKKGQQKIASAQEAEEYMGQYLRFRSPAYCLMPGTDRCLTCLGPRMEATPDGLATACANVGSVFTLVSMASAHSKGLNTVELDLMSDLS